MAETLSKEHQKIHSKFSIGEFVMAKGASSIVLWALDKEMSPTISVGKVEKVDVLLVLDVKELKEKNVKRHWKKAVHVLAPSGLNGWVGQGWLQRI